MQFFSKFSVNFLGEFRKREVVARGRRKSVQTPTSDSFSVPTEYNIEYSFVVLSLSRLFLVGIFSKI